MSDAALANTPAGFSGRKPLVTPTTPSLVLEMEEEVPYYKDYAVLESLQIIRRLNQFFFQANATRGVIAALVVVAIFLGYALLDRLPCCSIYFLS